MSDYLFRFSAWLAALKAGDTVAIPYGFCDHQLAKVTHTTTTQVHIGSTKYRRKDGRVIGGDCWSRNYIAEPTDEIIADIKERGLRRELADINWKNQTADTLEAVLKLIPKVTS